MADIFISYAKADRDHVVRLAAMLEAEGWSVWWDTSLLPGDDFRDTIMTELAKARAVVVLWTEASIRSDWVRSEAGRAQADRKLIPVKLSHLAYKDLPPPFDILHTENLDNTAASRAAVVAQLAKPEVPPSGWWVASKELRFQALTWIGIVGGTLTLFSGLSALLRLADWSRWLVAHSQELTQGFWRLALGWTGFAVPKPWVPVLSTVTFLVLVAIGQRVQARPSDGAVALPWPQLLLVIAASLALLSISIGVLRFAIGSLLGVVLLAALVIVAVLGPVAFTLRASLRQRASAAVTVMAWAAIGLLSIEPLGRMPLSYTQRDNALDALYFTIFILGWLLPAIMLAIAPARLLTRRLLFLSIGVALLLALNELSKLGVTLDAPRS